MVSMMLVAGGASKSLADFLEKRGTFTVTNLYPTLKESINEIQSQIIKVDKLLYLFNSEVSNESTDIRTEMRLLGKLLKDSTFFNPSEIIFMLKVSDASNIAIKYFKTVVEDANFDNYTIKQIDGKLTYEIVYSSIMGISQVRDFENTYRSVYKVSRDSTAELAYAAKDDNDMVVQLSDNYRLKDYESKRDLLIKTSSREEIVSDQNDKRTAIVDIPSASIDTAEVRQNVVLITGAGKSGKSIWTTVLGVSTVESGKNVCIIDLTNNQDLKFFLDKTNIGCKCVTFKEFVEEKERADFICCVPTDAEKDVKIPFINYILNEIYQYDVIYIVSELDQYGSFECIRDSIYRTIVLSTSREADIAFLSRKLLPTFYGNVSIILNNPVAKFANEKFLDNKEIRSYIPEKYRVIGSKKFTSLDVDSTYYKGVVK